MTLKFPIKPNYLSLTFWRKIVVLFIFLLSQYGFSQITVLGGAVMHSDGALVSSAENISENTSTNKKVKIYVSKDVQITDLGVESNFEVVEIHSNTKKNISRKHSVLNIAKKQIEKKNQPKLTIYNTNPALGGYHFSPSEPEKYFAFSNSSFKITISISQFSAKQSLAPESFRNSFLFHWDSLKLQTFKRFQHKNFQKSHQFSVRPPPLLV